MRGLGAKVEQVRRQNNERNQRMSSKLKVLGLSLVAAFAMSAVAASAASAVGIHGESATTHITVDTSATNDNLQLVLANGIAVRCDTTIKDGTNVGTATQEEIIVTPTFHFCKNSLGQNVTVTPGTCQFTLKATSTTTGDAALISCNAEGLIIHVFKAGEVNECTVTINNQVPTNPDFTIVNGVGSTGKKDITIISKGEKAGVGVWGVTYTSTGASCGASSTEGRMITNTAGVTATGFSNEAHTTPTGLTVA
jgi:hypothetical protein